MANGSLEPLSRIVGSAYLVLGVVEGDEEGRLAYVDVERRVHHLDLADLDHALERRVIALAAAVLDDDGSVVAPRAREAAARQPATTRVSPARDRHFSFRPVQNRPSTERFVLSSFQFRLDRYMVSILENSNGMRKTRSCRCYIG